MEDLRYPSPWAHTILVVRHHYYERKPRFEQAVDTYPMWAAFAVEVGEFHYRLGDAAGTASAGQLVLCPPDMPFHRHTARPITFHYFLFHWLDGAGKPVPSSELRGRCLSFVSTERWLSTLSSLRSPANVQHPAYRHWRSHALLDLLRLHAMEQALHAAPEPQPERVDPALSRARRMLDGACDMPLSIGHVAGAVGLTPVQLTRRFREAYGVTPSAYVEALRLDKVCHYLTHTEMTLEQIAHACGYSSGFYLSRVFANKMRIPPSEYRLLHRI